MLASSFPPYARAWFLSPTSRQFDDVICLVSMRLRPSRGQPPPIAPGYALSSYLTCMDPPPQPPATQQAIKHLERVLEISREIGEYTGEFTT